MPNDPATIGGVFARPGKALTGVMVTLLALWLMFAVAVNWGGGSEEPALSRWTTWPTPGGSARAAATSMGSKPYRCTRSVNKHS